MLVDGGGRLHRYSSDITRTGVFGAPPTDRQRRIWDAVRRAQQAAFEAPRPGAEAQAVDAAARRVVEDAGFGAGYRYFTHRVGHGIGMDGHEWTYLVKGNRTVLRPGMCFSDEPAIYIPGEMGVRHEDIVLITETGAEGMTKWTDRRRSRRWCDSGRHARESLHVERTVVAGRGTMARTMSGNGPAGLHVLSTVLPAAGILAAVAGVALLTVPDTPTTARTPTGEYISWKEHLVDDEQLGGVPIRGSDGLQIADFDGDGILDIVSVHEDSNHVRLAFGSKDPDR